MTAISGRTRLLGLIADPVLQARSPAMANGLLEARGLHGAFVLVPLQVPVGALDAVVGGLRRLGSFAGALVSMPHKAAIVPLLDELTDEAALVGAVNVVRRTADGRLVGTMMDGEGFVAGLRAAKHEVGGAACLLVGAGGAASAIAFALARHGCRSLAIVNRTASRAAELAARVRAAFPAVGVRHGDAPDARYDLAVNATSLGMHIRDELPMSRDVVARAALVADCVVAPEMTALPRWPRRAGVRSTPAFRCSRRRSRRCWSSWGWSDAGPSARHFALTAATRLRHR
jgi:shikimate dehydrogenase